jgi:hypothetical protein
MYVAAAGSGSRQEKEGSAMKRSMLIMVVVVLGLTIEASSDTWYITPDGSGDYADIKTGAYYASNGDTLLLADGVYTGRGNTSISYYGKALTITSESGDPHACVIDCEGSASNWTRGFEFYSGEGPGSVLEGISIRNGYMYEGGGIWCWGASPTISNVILVDNIATYSGGAIYCGGGPAPVIANVTFYGNSAPAGGGISCTDGSSPSVSKSIVAHSQQGGAVYSDDVASVPSFVCSDVFGNVGGDWQGSISGQHSSSGNISMDPVFCLDDNPDQPYTLSSGSPCVCACTADGAVMGAAGIGCSSGELVAVIDIDPDVFNPRRRGRWVTCHIELPEGYDPEGIDVSTVMLNDTVPAEAHPTSVGDYDDDGVADRMVKFLWRSVIDSLEVTGDVEIHVSGQVAGEPFAGVDTVRVLYKDAKMHRLDQDDLHVGTPRIGVTNQGYDDDGIVIKCDVPEQAHVRLTVYDVRGRTVTELVNEVKPAGAYSITWDGTDASNSKVAPGFYFAKYEAGMHRDTAKIVVVR